MKTITVLSGKDDRVIHLNVYQTVENKISISFALAGMEFSNGDQVRIYGPRSLKKEGKKNLVQFTRLWAPDNPIKPNTKGIGDWFYLSDVAKHF